MTKSRGGEDVEKTLITLEVVFVLSIWLITLHKKEFLSHMQISDLILQAISFSYSNLEALSKVRISLEKKYETAATSQSSAKPSRHLFNFLQGVELFSPSMQALKWQSHRILGLAANDRTSLKGVYCRKIIA